MDDLSKGLLAGVIGGLAATLAKTIWEDHFPVRSESTETPPALIAERVSERVADHALTEAEKQQTETAIHWTFGTGTGVLYGVLAEATPPITALGGIPFGVGFYAATHGSVVPAAGLEPWPTQVRRDYAISEFAGHLVYAGTLEIVRRLVRSTM